MFAANPEIPNFIEYTPVLDTSAYASGDVLFAAPKELNVLYQGRNLARLKQLIVVDSTFQNKALDLYFFDKKPAATFVANAAFAPTAADMANLIAMVPLAAGTAFAAVSHQQLDLTREVVLKPRPGYFSIWFLAVSKGTGTYTASALKFRFLFVS